MQKLIFTSSTGQSISLGDTPPFILSAIDGLGDVSANTQTQSSPLQDGSTYINSMLEERFIAMEITIIAPSKSELSNTRQFFSSVFNPKLGEGTLTYIFGETVKEIGAVSEHVPVFPSGNGNRIENIQKSMVSLKCPNPYWRNTEKEKSEIALWEPLFEFPLEIGSTGIEMGVRSPSLIVNVVNDGHVQAGMMIKFKALGTVVNPSLFNVNTREWIKLNRTMTAGEIITINTNRGKKRIESSLNGEKFNIFNSIANGSKFLQLDIGDNLFRYDADNFLEALEVDIYYSPQFVGV